MGMDRPWISNGLRIARISSADVPALLLQRVALLRPKPALDAGFMYWAYKSSRFRDEVEVDLTGLSVPHISGPQIEDFRLPILSLDEQRRRASDLDAMEREIREARIDLRRSTALLNERKRALITAAVTGEFDVSSAGPRACTAVTA